jgi:hypothetical protein
MPKVEPISVCEISAEDAAAGFVKLETEVHETEDGLRNLEKSLREALRAPRGSAVDETIERLEKNLESTQKVLRRLEIRRDFARETVAAAVAAEAAAAQGKLDKLRVARKAVVSASNQKIGRLMAEIFAEMWNRCEPGSESLTSPVRLRINFYEMLNDYRVKADWSTTAAAALDDLKNPQQRLAAHAVLEEMHRLDSYSRHGKAALMELENSMIDAARKKQQKSKK